MKLYKHFKRINGKYIDDEGNRVTIDELMQRSHHIFDDDGYISLPVEDQVMPNEVVSGEQIIEEAIKHIYPNELDKYTTKTHYDSMEEKQEIIDYIIENFNLVRKCNF